MNTDYEIIAVDEEDGDKGVYIDNQDGGPKKDKLIGHTPYADSFAGYIDKNYKKAKIHLNTSINIAGMSEAIADENTQFSLIDDFRLGHKLDLKKQLIEMKYTGNPMDGIIRQSDGLIIPVRSAGNQFFGQTVARNGYGLTPSMKAAGAYQQKKGWLIPIATGIGSTITDSIFVNSLIGYGTAPHWGEEAVTGRDIITGYKHASSPATRTEKYSAHNDIINHYINVKKQ